jgi:hypothetical protein
METNPIKSQSTPDTAGDRLDGTRRKPTWLRSRKEWPGVFFESAGAQLALESGRRESMAELEWPVSTVSHSPQVNYHSVIWTNYFFNDIGLIKLTGSSSESFTPYPGKNRIDV